MGNERSRPIRVYSFLKLCEALADLPVAGASPDGRSEPLHHLALHESTPRRVWITLLFDNGDLVAGLNQPDQVIFNSAASK